jgi:hypothetical protein
LLTINAASTAGTNFQSSLEAGEYYDCQDINGGMNATVWYKFVVGVAGTYYVNFDQTAGTYFNGAAVWDISSLPTGPCHPIQCMDNENIGVSTTFSMILSNLSIGTYYIQVGEFKNTDNTDAFKISVNTTSSYTTYNAAPLNTPTTAATGCYLNSCNPSNAAIEACGAQFTLKTSEGYPSAASVGDGFSATNGVAGNGYTTQACYKWTNANVSGSAFCDAYLSYFIPGSCHSGGGQEWVDWTLYNSAGTNVITCGGGTVTAANLTVTGVACTGTYVLCFMWQNIGCEYNDDGFAGNVAIYAYTNYPSCAPPACTVLPIQLIDFTAEYQQDNNLVYLNWATATESNNKYFQIERSTDGINFDVIGQITGAGNSITEKYYSMQDDNPVTGTSYYRLRQTDYDGNSQIFNVIPITIQNDIIKIFPNPATGMLNIEFDCIQSENAEMFITDVMGETIINENYNFKEGSNLTKIDISNYSPGVYFVNIQGHHFKFIKK